MKNVPRPFAVVALAINFLLAAALVAPGSAQALVVGGNTAPAAQAGTAAAPRVWKVGPDRALTTPSEAAAKAGNGDTIEIDAGTYSGDVATWTQNDLTIKGVGGKAHLKADGKNAQGKAIWVIAGDRTTVVNIEFSGAAVPDKNGAGIRQEGTDLTVKKCVFHDNENGILTGADAKSDIKIVGSKFFDNGAGDGYSHNIYVGAVGSFTLLGSSITTAKVGHEVKSRAQVNTIKANQILDKSGTASYSIDLPNGGESLIAGNVIEQGPKSENPALISYGAEGLTNSSSHLWIVNNTLVNNRKGGTFVVLADGAHAHLWNNLLVGSGKLSSGSVEKVKNKRTKFGFTDPEKYDFTLLATSPAINRGDTPPSAYQATHEFRSPLGMAVRNNVVAIDLGAFERKS